MLIKDRMRTNLPRELSDMNSSLSIYTVLVTVNCKTGQNAKISADYTKVNTPVKNFIDIKILF